MSYFPTVIDNTMRSAYLRCPQAFKREHIDGYAPLVKSWDAHAGICFAAGVEAARLAYFRDGAPYAQCIEAGEHAVSKEWGDYKTPKSLFNFKTRERMIGAIAYYFDAWPFEDDGYKPYLLHGNKQMIEVSAQFKMNVVHPVEMMPLKWSVRFDFLALDPSGGLTVIDEKTKGKIDENFAAKYDLDGQILGYMWAADQLTMMPTRAEIRGISILKNQYGHATVPIVKERWMLTRWWEQVNRDALNMVYAYKRGEWNFNFGDACNPFGRSCEYKQLCLASNPERLIDGNYKLEFWNPVTRERK